MNRSDDSPRNFLFLGPKTYSLEGVAFACTIYYRVYIIVVYIIYFNIYKTFNLIGGSLARLVLNL